MKLNEYIHSNFKMWIFAYGIFNFHLGQFSILNSSAWPEYILLLFISLSVLITKYALDYWRGVR